LKSQVLKTGFLCKRVIVLAALILFCAVPCYSFELTLKWDPIAVPDLDGYIIYYDTDSGLPYDGTEANEGTSEKIILDANTTTVQLTGLTNMQTYYFAVTSFDTEGFESTIGREICVLGSIDLDPGYDKGRAITSGNLKGLAVFYSTPLNAANDTPTLGPSTEIPDLHDEFPSEYGVGVPLNLQPSPSGYFFNPVKIFVPCPDYSDVSGLDIYYYNGSNWALADYTWMVAGTRVDHDIIPPHTIEF
jgi:hypothetical protein